MLEKEVAFFQQHQGEWAARFAGKFVLVRGEELVGAYDTVETALAEGARRFGLTSFLVRPVSGAIPQVSIPALTTGVFDANRALAVQP